MIKNAATKTEVYKKSRNTAIAHLRHLKRTYGVNDPRVTAQQRLIDLIERRINQLAPHLPPVPLPSQP